MKNSNINPDIMVYERSLRDYLDVVLRRLWIVIPVFVTVLLLTALYAFTRTPLYTSAASVEVEEKSRQAKDKDSVFGSPEYEQFKGYLATQIEILRSRSLAEALCKRMNLTDSPEFSGGAFDWITNLFSSASDDGKGSASAQAAKEEKVVDRLMKRISVKAVKQSNLLEVHLDSTDPALGSKMLQNYLELYLQRNLEKRRTESLQAAEWLQDELTKVEQKLRNAQIAMLDFTVEHGIVDTKDGGITQVLAVLNKKMESQVKAQEARAKVQSLDGQTPTDEASLLLPKEISNEYIGKLKQELAMMESEYTQMRGLYSANYPKLRMLEKKIKFLTDRIATMEKNLVSSAIDSAKKEEKLLETSYDTTKKEAGRVKSLEAEYSTLRKDVDTNTEFQKILLKEYKQMDIRARTITNDVKVVDQPSMPSKPSWPKKRMFLLIGVAAGLVLGVATAFVLDQFDTTLRTPEDIDVNLNVKRLGIVPHLAKLPKGQEVDASVTPYELLAHQYPKSAISDAIRNIQTSILLSYADHPTKCMAVSSAVPSEGKSLITVSLATVLASDGAKKVLVVDADMRKPRLHKVFGLQDPGAGLSNLMNGNPVELSQVIHQHRIPGLFYITSGPIPRDPVSLLIQTEKTREIFQQLKALYDYVIVDCPPVLGFADTPMICQAVDGLIMVARQGHVGRDELREAMEMVSSGNGCKVLGVVLNMAHAPGGGGYSYRYGGHYYTRNYKYYSRGA